MKYEGLIIRPPSEAESLILQIAVGCSHNACTFCPAYKKKKFRIKSLEEVYRDIDEAAACSEDTRRVFLCDGDPLIIPQHTLLPIVERINEQFSRLLRIGIYANAGSILGKTVEELKELREQKLGIIYLGLESVNPGTLRTYRKKLTVEEIEQGIGKFHQYGIRTHGMFVLGADTDDVATIKQTAKFAIKNKIDTVQFLILTPMPGTKHYQDLEAEGRLLTRDWSLYDGHHVVYQPGLMTAYQLQKETMKAMAKFYSNWQLIQLVLRLDFLTFIYRSYGNHLVARWRRERVNRKYYQMMREVSRGTVAKLGDNYRKSAEDIRRYFKRLQKKDILTEK